MENVQDDKIRFIKGGALLNIRSEKYLKDIQKLKFLQAIENSNFVLHLKFYHERIN